MIFPCIDLMDGKVVQLVQGREKALEGPSPEEMLERFAGFAEIQVIDLDAALGRGSNDRIVEFLASRARIRAGGGVRTPERFRALLDQGLVIVRRFEGRDGAALFEVAISANDCAGRPLPQPLT